MEQDPESRDSIENFTTDYKIIRTLGRGRFSVVKMAYHVPTLTCVAIKVLKNTEKCSSVMSREVDLLKSLGGSSYHQGGRSGPDKRGHPPGHGACLSGRPTGPNPGMWIFKVVGGPKNV